MSDDKNAVLELWTELKMVAEALDKDVAKNTGKSNVSAGVRVRKGVRRLRDLGAQLLRAALLADKSVVAERKGRKAEKASDAPPVTVDA